MNKNQSIWNTCIGEAIRKAKLASTMISKDEVDEIITRLQSLLDIDEIERSKKYKEALEEIVAPIKFMQDRLKGDEQLNGLMAQSMASDHNYLKSIAKNALTLKPHKQ